MTLVAEPATIPFHVLPLVSTPVQDLPGLDRGAWECLGEWSEGGAKVSRWRYAAGRGQVDGVSVPMHVLARAVNGTVWAVGVAVPGFFVVVEDPDDPSEPQYLVAIPHAPGDPEGTINWMSQDGRRYFDVGLAP